MAHATTNWRKGKLIKRYKRFLADILLDGESETITAHCANSGSLKGLCEPGSDVWVSYSPSPTRKLPYTWELVEDGSGGWVGINTSVPNRIVRQAIEEGRIPELAGYDTIRPEVKYGENSRIDLLLSKEEVALAADSSRQAAPAASLIARDSSRVQEASQKLCYLEIKSVTLKNGDYAEFPDAVTARGAKHMRELAEMVKQGHRAAVFFCVQRQDCTAFRPARDIDPTYAAALEAAIKEGVEVLCYTCTVAPEGVRIASPLHVIV